MKQLRKFLKDFILDPEITRRRESLRKISLFKNLKSSQMTHVLTMLYRRRYQEGEIVFQEGDIGRALVIVESGKVALTKKDKKGDSKTIAELGDGEFFGEMALLEEMPRSASAAASEPSTLFLLYKNSLDELITDRPDIGAPILSSLAALISSRLRGLSHKLANGESA